jgi:hypothetical protein
MNYTVDKLSSSTKVRLENIDTRRIRKLLVELGSPVIPLTLLFEALGFRGVTGIEWGILAGAISALATEMGYEVQRLGRSVVLVRHTKDSAQSTEALEEDLKSSEEDVQKK